MARPIWNGSLSFGLLHVPIQLMPGERRTDISFRMLDSRNNKPVRYERVNSETGDEVPWKDIVKAFEYHKGSYVVLDEDDIRAAAPESHEAVEIETFVDADAIDPAYYEKPYVLVPGKKAEKGYVLLRDTLADAGKIGIARVVVRTREYLAAVIPQRHALILMLLRYPQELIDVDEYAIPEKKASAYRVTPKEMDMARQLIDSMSGAWKPADFRDEFRARLHKVIAKRLKQKGVVKAEPEETKEHESAATNVVDFMELLKKSIATSKRTPAKTVRKAPAKRAAKKAPAKRAGTTRRKSA
jgi:DNA end-binding protein Ku